MGRQSESDFFQPCQEILTTTTSSHANANRPRSPVSTQKLSTILCGSMNRSGWLAFQYGPMRSAKPDRPAPKIG